MSLYIQVMSLIKNKRRYNKFKDKTKNSLKNQVNQKKKNKNNNKKKNLRRKYNSQLVLLIRYLTFAQDTISCLSRLPKKAKYD